MTMINVDKIKETLRRLNAVRECPTAYAGEKANADALIKKISEKYGLSVTEFLSDKPVEWSFAYKNAKEKKLIMQLLAHVFGYKRFCELRTYSYRSRKEKRVYVELTNEDFVTASEYITHYLANYRQQLRNFYHAFVIANKLFTDGPAKAPTGEDWEAYKMAEGMSARPLRKQLEAPAEGREE